MGKRKHKGYVDSKPIGAAIKSTIAKLRKLRAKVAPEEKKYIDLRIGELNRCYYSVKSRCRIDPWYLPISSIRGQAKRK